MNIEELEAENIALRAENEALNRLLGQQGEALRLAETELAQWHRDFAGGADQPGEETKEVSAGA